MRIRDDLRGRAGGTLSASVLGFFILLAALSLLNAMLLVGAGGCKEIAKSEGGQGSEEGCLVLETRGQQQCGRRRQRKSD